MRISSYFLLCGSWAADSDLQVWHQPPFPQTMSSAQRMVPVIIVFKKCCEQGKPLQLILSWCSHDSQLQWQVKPFIFWKLRKGRGNGYMVNFMFDIYYRLRDHVIKELTNKRLGKSNI